MDTESLKVNNKSKKEQGSKVMNIDTGHKQHNEHFVDTTYKLKLKNEDQGFWYISQERWIFYTPIVFYGEMEEEKGV